MDILGKEAIARVTGKTPYTGDLLVPGVVIGKVLRSPHAHARILRIGASKADVFGVLTREDLQGIRPYYELAYKGQPLVALDKVRYEGEPVAVIAAIDEAAALEAPANIEVEYETLPAVMNMDQALAPGAPLVHEEPFLRAGYYQDLMNTQPIEGTNICHHGVFEGGDVEKGLAMADRVFESTFTCPPVNHYPMELLSTIADFQGDYIKV